MRCYIIASGIIFTLMVVAHVARVFAEGAAVLREPMVISTTLLSAGMAIWAAVLLFNRRL